MWFSLEVDSHKFRRRKSSAGDGSTEEDSAPDEYGTLLRATPDGLAHLISELTRVLPLPVETEHQLNYPDDVADDHIPIAFVMIVPEAPPPPSPSPEAVKPWEERLVQFGCLFTVFLLLYGFVRFVMDVGGIVF